ncbi:MAG: hypothetical protein AB7F28_02870 [Candidatus Margulisiibacteriota bacterium]
MSNIKNRFISRMLLGSLFVVTTLLSGCGDGPIEAPIRYKYSTVSKETLVSSFKATIQQVGLNTLLIKEENGLFILQNTNRVAPAQAVIRLTPSQNSTIVTVETVKFSFEPKQFSGTGDYARLFETLNKTIGVTPERLP